MRKKFFLFFILTAMVVYGKSAAGQGSVFVSVKDFGAKGDGKADDTRAIQAAVDYAAKEGFSKSSISGVYDKSTIYFGASKTVFFPAGIYSISQTLKAGYYVDLRGEKAVLVPAKNLSNKLDAIQAIAWQASIEGLQFISFGTALKLNNNNVNVGKVSIVNCDFLGNQVAIELKAQSSISIIRENRFHGNNKALIVLAGDKVDMTNNWITSAPLKGLNDSQIENRGILHFDKNLLVPVRPEKSAIEPAWINNYGTVYASGVRQGGEPGSFTLVNNFAEADTQYPIVPRSVSIINSDCYAVYGNTANYRQPAALRLIKMPNNIVLENLKGFVDANVIGFSQQAGIKEANFANYNKNNVMVRISNIQGSLYKNQYGKNIPLILEKYASE